MSDLPSGTVTFLFTDIEGSTNLLQRLGDTYADTLDDHRRLLREAFARNRGHEIGTEGDSFFVTFAHASDAVAAALEGQRALHRHGWAHGAELRVRMGIHTGDASVRERDYVGLAVHEAARVAAAAHGGQVLVTRATCELAGHAAALRSLGAHKLKDIVEPIELFQLVHPDLPSDFPPLRSLDARPNNLPLQLTSFVGREHEMIEVRRAIEQSRLVTVTGAGGVGKTRLALEVGTDLLDEFPDGVWFVDLAAISDGGTVPNEIAAVIGVRDQQQTNDVFDALVKHIRTKHVLVTLDNCEHVLGSAASVAERLLSSCPQLHILVTSREPLGVGGEVSWRIPSLDLPETGAEAAAAGEFASVRLFVDRARAVRHDFELSDDVVRHVARICRRLDGIPLAIELAAARVRSLSCPAIADRLDDRFRLLVGGSRTALPRQRTLEALVDWSYDLLDDSERTLLRRLSVFAGSFSLEGAEAVCASYDLDGADVLRVLEALIDKSLVQSEQAGMRYRLLETIRQYARYKLVEAGDADAARKSHLAYYTELSERTWRDVMSGPNQRATVELFEAEHDNFRAALDWGTEAEPELALRLAGPLGWFWWLRGYHVEGMQRLDAVLEADNGSATMPRAAALIIRGFLDRLHSGDVAATDSLATEAATIARALPGAAGAGWILPWALDALAMVANARGDADRAKELAAEAVAVAHEAGEFWAEARSRQELASALTRQGRAAEALGQAEEALAIFRRIDEASGISRLLLTVADLAIELGEPNRALDAGREALQVSRQAADRPGESIALNYLTILSMQAGDFEAGRSYADEGVAFARDWGDTSHLVGALNVFGYAAACAGNLVGAQSALDEAIALAREASVPFLADILHSRGEIAVAMDELDAARRFYDESHVGFVANGNSESAAMVEGYLALVACRQGNLAEATDLARRALRASDNPAVRWPALSALAREAGLRGHMGRAARLLAAADALRPAPPGGLVADPGDAELRRDIDTVLEPDERERAFADGRSWTADEAIAYAYET